MSFLHLKKDMIVLKIKNLFLYFLSLGICDCLEEKEIHYSFFSWPHDEQMFQIFSRSELLYRKLMHLQVTVYW